VARYRVSPQAKADLKVIANYLIEDNPDRAISFTEEFVAKFRQIGDRPNSYTARDDLRSGLRSAVHGKYLIFYRVDAHGAHILRVVHGARNLTAIFKGSGD
jgi:toxin ParE1/3/4